MSEPPITYEKAREKLGDEEFEKLGRMREELLARGDIMLLSELRQYLPAVLPWDWRIYQQTEDGVVYARSNGMRVIVTCDRHEPSGWWMHVSCSMPNRLPNWDEYRAVKELFVGRERFAYQVLPPAKEYVNIHPNVLHMFCPLAGPQLPDFTRGVKTI